MILLWDRYLLMGWMCRGIMFLNMARILVWLVRNQRTHSILGERYLTSRLYQGTVRFNILLGANKEDVSQEEIDKACQDANVPHPHLRKFYADFRFTNSFSHYRKDMRPW